MGKKLISKKLENKIEVMELGSGDPKIAILNGLHGLERSGAYLMYRFYEKLNLEKGLISFIPFANPTSFKENTRLTPEDSQDLNRIFPGDPKGGLSFRVAHALFEYLKDFDLVIDIHNFPKMSMPLVGVFFYKGSDEQKKRTYSLLNSFKPDYIWKLDTLRDEAGKAGSLVESIISEGRLSFAIEAPDIELLEEDQIDKFVSGMTNVVKAMEDVVKETESSDAPVITRIPALSKNSGFFVPTAKVGEEVKKGDILGEVVSVNRFKKSVIVSPIHGPVIFILRKTFVDSSQRCAIVGNYTNV